MIKFLKDDCKTKIHLVCILMHFNSFKNKDRLLYNKFSTENRVLNPKNPEILKPNWYPAGDYLIKGTLSKKNTSFCNLPINDSPPCFLSEVSQKLLIRSTKSTSIDMGIKPSRAKEPLLKVTK